MSDRAVYTDAAAERQCQRMACGEAEARAWQTFLFGGGTTHKFFENQFLLFGEYAGTAIADLNVNIDRAKLIRIAFRSDFDRTTWRILDRIADEIGDDRFDLAGVAFEPIHESRTDFYTDGCLCLAVLPRDC